MNGSTFIAAQRAPVLINRQKELDIIRRAIYQPDASLQIVLIRGAGGMGKSRLMEEVLWRAGNRRARQQNPRPDVPAGHDWTVHGSATMGDMIDMNDVRLQSRTEFLHAIRDALVGLDEDIAFPLYDAAYREFETRAYSGDIRFLEQLEREAEQAFFQDYRQNANRKRIVLVVDTVEKLYPIGGTQLLLSEGLLTERDTASYTYQWLRQQIREATLPNTTLLLVGRAQEGKEFFDEIERLANQSSACRVISLPEIGPFSLDDTRTYFQTLVESWKATNGSNPYIQNIVASFSSLLEDPNRLEVLWRYTAGQPVRLALYADLIIEDVTLPPSLLEEVSQARLAAETPGQLEEIQRAIEAGFIRLLFRRSNLRSNILQLLVRTPRGLNAEQIHYILTSHPKESVQAWLARHNTTPGISHQEIENELEALRNLALTKIRPDGRLALQDEVYRIYGRALASSEPQRLEEQKARRSLYEKLQAWAEYHYEQALQDVRRFLEEDERQLRLDRPSQAPTITFPQISDREESHRSHARAQMNYWKMERLHYALLADYRQAFNHFLFEEAQSLWLANSERDLVLLQAERWQPLLDPAYALEEFGHLEPWSSLQARGESPFVAFRRIALQDDVTTWIMVHILRKEFKRAVEFAETLEAKIPHWCDAHPDDPNFLKPSWLHTLARHERALWRNTAKVYIGEKTQPILEEMKKAVAELEKLLRHSQEEVVFPDRGDGETGFLGHPAEKKVLRLIALYYNYIGYGYANLGATRSAKDAYSRALRAMRDVDFPHMEATTRNNFSRVLSDRSHVRGRRLCLDGLKLRKEQGLEIPLAYSYNTLALIDNDHGRSDLAWMEAAIAVAYFRRANDPRGLGLALLQLGEALRRLANRRDEIFQLRGDSPEIVFKAADRALSEAVRIFTTGPLAGEKVRRVEAWIELGSLERDRMRTVEEDSPSRERYYRDAVSHLTQAAQLAHELGNKRLELDARVNLAWTHYRYPDFVLAERALQQAEDLLPDDCRIQEGFLPGPERNDIYVYEQLSRMEGLRGRIALESFLQIVEEKKKNIPDREERRRQIHEDEKAQEYLKMAAEHFVKALTYAQLQSPRSHALRLTYDSIYDYLKEFNITELNDFYRQVRLAIDRYGLIQKYEPNSLCLIDLGRLDEFLEQMFGLSSEEGAFHER